MSIADLGDAKILGIASSLGRPCADTIVASSQGTPILANAIDTDDTDGYTVINSPLISFRSARNIPKNPGSPDASMTIRISSSAH